MSGRARIMLAAMLGAWWCSAQPCRGAGYGPPGRMSDDQRKRAAEYNRIAEEHYRRNDHPGGAVYTRKIVVEFPGRMEVVHSALWRLFWIHGSTREWAQERIVALCRSGDLPRTDQLVHDAYIAWASTLAAKGRTLRAAQLMAEAGRVMRRDVKWRYANAKLHYDVGSFQAPRMFYELVVELHRRRDDPKLKDLVEVFWPTQPRSDNYYLRCAQAYRRGPLSVAAIRIHGDEDVKWFISPNRPLRGMAGEIDRLIAESLGQVDRATWDDEANEIAPWYAVDRQLSGRKPGELAGLRKVQEDACRRETGRADLPEMPTDKLLAIYRRYPWARSGHRALIAHGRKVLWAGRPRAAIRSFRDVLSHTVEPALRDAALAGVWLALAQGRSRSDLDAAFDRVDPGKTFTWMGRTVKAGEIRRELSAGLANTPAPPPAPKLAGLTRRLVRVPAVVPWPSQSYGSLDMPWPSVDMQFAGPDVLVSAPNILARYSVADCTAPLWRRTARTQVRPQSWRPGRYRPAIADGRLYTRWGNGDIPTDLAAVDMQTGRLVWSTAKGPTLSGHQRHRLSGFRPVNDPVIVDGRLYVLACTSQSVSEARHGRHRSGTPVSLFCLDAGSGAVLWETPLWPALVGWAIRSDRPGLTHSTWCGLPVTIRDGAVYCVSNAGQVARCDMRDGRLCWLYEYPRTRGLPGLIRGVGPLIVGEKLIVRPRDHAGIFALDRHTGRMIWHNAFVRPATEIGVLGRDLLVHNRTVITSLDIETGKVRWFDEPTGGIIGPGQLIGQWIYSGTPEALTRRDARTGAVVERLPWGQGDRTVQSFAIHNDTLYTVTDEACADGNVEVGRPMNPRAPDKAPALTFPLERAWHLPQTKALLHVSPPEADGAVRAYLVSGSLAQCIDATGQGRLRWRRFVRPGAREVWSHEGKLLLRYPHCTETRNARTGALLAKIAMPPEIRDTKPSRFGQVWLHKRSTFFGAMDMVSGRVLWKQNHTDFAGRPNWAPSGHLYWDGKNFHVITETWQINLTRHVVLAGADGSIVSTTDITPANDGRPLTAFYSKGRCVFAVENKKLYCYALDGKQAALVPNAPPAVALAGYDRPFVLLNTTDPKTRKRHQLVLRDDDPNYAFRGEDDFVGLISDRKLSTMLAAAGKISIIDLARKKEVVRCQLPDEAKDPRHKRFLTARFWQSGRTLTVLSTVNDELRLDMFDAASGAHKGGQVLRGVHLSSRSPQNWDGVVQVGGVLLIADQTGAQAWTSAYGRKKPVRFLPEPAAAKGSEKSPLP